MEWQPNYGHHALGMIQRRGYRHLRACCLSCGHIKWLDIWQVMDKLGPAADLLAVARRARCANCRHRGAHVDIAPPPSPDGGIYYEEWCRHRLVYLTLAYNELNGWLLGSTLAPINDRAR